VGENEYIHTSFALINAGWQSPASSDVLYYAVKQLVSFSCFHFVERSQAFIHRVSKVSKYTYKTLLVVLLKQFLQVLSSGEKY
jgi:hypothetical protein